MLAAILMALSQAAPSPSFDTRPCADSKLPRATCGVVRVPENRSILDGRQIELNVIVLKSATPARLPPLFDLDGGPGLPSTKNAGFYAFNDVSKDRDVVMVDQRGTGRSNALACPELAAVPATEAMLPAAAVARCREALQRKAELSFYGTRDAVEDLEAVRRALGYGKIDLFGLSYGTTVALRYMHRYPDNVRAAVMMGTAPPDAMPPRHHATAAERALRKLLDDCGAKPECAERFPALAAKLEKARSNAPISSELFMERLRTLFYSPTTRASLPLAIDSAAAGDYSKLLGTKAETGASMIADGMFLAVTCGESFGLMDYDQASERSRATPFGDYRLRQQKAACAGWPRVHLDEDHLQLPTRSTASVLLISGDWDPVTPPEWAENVARRLPKARHVVVPYGGHIPDGMEGLESCLDPVMIAFLDHGDPASVDASCVSSMRPPPYEGP